MKICHTHICRLIGKDLDIETLSKNLFQLGHENEIIDNIIDVDITPNRGDCLSLLGLARDLNIFYDTNCELPVYESKIENFNLDFNNTSKLSCPSICFLNISIKDFPNQYIPEIESYFSDLNLNKNNFFTDISNYVAYEIGQPTHCYDIEKIEGTITLSHEKIDKKFLTLLDQEISLNDANLVFKDDKDIINLAGVIGSKKTSCSSKTKNAIIESAYFNPEAIIGKSTKYNINSEAAHKFERGVDPLMQEKALRRFIYLVQQHAEIKNLKLYKYVTEDFKTVELDSNITKINKILGTNIKEQEYLTILSKLGFEFDKKIIIPSHRFDIEHQNDLAEEVARAIGYDDIKPIKFEPHITANKKDIAEDKIKLFLKDNGFYEVINMPFTRSTNLDSVKIDNPLDINRSSFRSELLNSLVMNLDYNERRQKDSVKLFEISDIYSFKKELGCEKRLALIVSGRQGHNHKEFSKKLDKKYLIDLFKNLGFNCESIISKVSRSNINSKNKNPIFALEANFNELTKEINLENIVANQEINFNAYVDISEFPSTARDISFSIKNIDALEKIERRLLSYKSINLKESFVFDFYNNEKDKVVKLGFRFIFQSKTKTLEDKEIKIEIKNIISLVEDIKGIHIPGLE